LGHSVLSHSFCKETKKKLIINTGTLQNLYFGFKYSAHQIKPEITVQTTMTSLFTMVFYYLTCVNMKMSWFNLMTTKKSK
jgi:hypothetical protein